MSVLHEKYRPREFEEVVGQSAAVKSLRGLIKRGASRAFLLSGPSGVGKTTLARIAARALGCLDRDVVEINAAVNTGIDAMRQVQELTYYRPFGASAWRALIVDECFAAGTLVETPSGPVPIESLRSGDLVLGVTGVQTVRRVTEKVVPHAHVIRLRLADGTYITCSGDHPFLTCRGWRSASRLNGKSVLICNGDPLPQDLYEVWDRIYEQRARCALVWKLLYARLCHVWGSIQEAAELYYRDLLGSLWQPLGRDEEDWAPVFGGRGPTTRGAAPQQREEPRDVGGGGPSEFRADDCAQPHPRPGGARKNSDDEAQERDPGMEERAWREWYGPDPPPAVALLACWWGVGVSGLLWRQAQGLAYLLQSGYWLPSAKAGGGGGRDVSQARRPQENRSAQRSAIKVVGVDRTSLRELGGLRRSGDSRDDNSAAATFYDLEIVEHPSFCVGGGLIAHNCHALSRPAWQSLLKALEEPPEFVAWLLCTTEVGKVPTTTKTRCAPVQLRAVAERDLRTLLDRVLREEGAEMDREVREVVVREAEGSPRQMLVNAAACADARGRREASDILRSARESGGVADLCKVLMSRGSWARAMAVLDKLSGEGPESVRIGVCNYMGGALRRARTDREACALLALIEPFAEPLPAGADRAALVVAVGRALYGGDE